MGEWWTYGPGELLMFSPRVWYRLLELHNRAWWPLQPVAMVAGIGLLWAIHRRLRPALRLGLVLVGAALVFVGWSFHGLRFSSVNLAAPYYAGAFIAEGVLLVAWAAWRRDLVMPSGNWASRAGVALLAAAVLLYPVLVLVWVRPMAQSEWFGLAPDPTMLAALGLLLVLTRCTGLRRPRLAWLLLSLLPLVWCAITGITLRALGAPEWWLMPVAGALVCPLAWWQSGRRRQARTPGYQRLDG